jgi:hypothetical protein
MCEGEMDCGIAELPVVATDGTRGRGKGVGGTEDGCEK